MYAFSTVFMVVVNSNETKFLRHTVSHNVVPGSHDCNQQIFLGHRLNCQIAATLKDYNMNNILMWFGCIIVCHKLKEVLCAINVLKGNKLF